MARQQQHRNHQASSPYTILIFPFSALLFGTTALGQINAHISSTGRGDWWEEGEGGMLHQRHQLSNGLISILQFLHVQNQQLKNILYNGIILN